MAPKFKKKIVCNLSGVLDSLGIGDPVAIDRDVTYLPLNHVASLGGDFTWALRADAHMESVLS